MLKLTFEAAAPREDAPGVKEQIAMMLERLGYRDIRCTEVRVVRPEQLQLACNIRNPVPQKKPPE